MSDPLDPKRSPLDSPDSPMDEEPDTIATPEGDGEPVSDAAIERPRGDEPHSEMPLRKAQP
jgi:hypothetical protein